VLKWTDEVYPARIEAGGAGIEITWDEYNAMRAAAGFRSVKRINDEEGRAGFNHRLRARVTASEALLTEAVKALEPFAQAAETGTRLNVGDLRRARATLSKIKAEAK
jgi:hypothetical protein